AAGRSGDRGNLGRWPREESNLRTQLRRLPLYPLSYGAGRAKRSPRFGSGTLSGRGGGSSVGRAPGCGPGGRGVESSPPPSLLALLKERRRSDRMPIGMRKAWIPLLVVVGLTLVAPAVGLAKPGADPETQLAEKYAPVVRLVKQSEPCG